MAEQFFYKSSCDTCRKALKVVRGLRPEIPTRNFSREPLTRVEIEHILNVAGGVAPVLNTYNQRVRAEGWRANPPAREHYIEAVLGDNNLIRRPVLIAGDAIVIGRDEDAYRRLLG